MPSGDAFTRFSKTNRIIDKSRERIDRHVRNSLLDTKKTLWRWCNDSFFSAENRRRALKWAETDTWQGSKKVPRQNEAQDLWHGSKTALSIATGPRFLFFTTLWKALQMKTRLAEKFTDVSGGKVTEEDGFCPAASRSKQSTIMKE